MKSVLIIPFFIGYSGCPNRCIFCNVSKIGGLFPKTLSSEYFRQTVDNYLQFHRKTYKSIQIAFYGGNFTGMETSSQKELFKLAAPYISSNKVDSIRISTRPDYIDDDRITLLKENSVRTVEIGAQSMNDRTLTLSRRGHTASDVREAVTKLKEAGVETGIHLMLGLPGDSCSSFLETIEEIIKLRPDMVRIHPTLVFQETELAHMYRHYTYQPLTLPEAVDLCKIALKKFTTAGIPVIRIGLQPNEEMLQAGSILAGPFHPAFRSLVESALFYDAAVFLIERQKIQRDAEQEVIFQVSGKDISSFRGLKNRNITALQNAFGLHRISVQEDRTMPKGYLALYTNDQPFKSRQGTAQTTETTISIFSECERRSCV